MNNTHRPRANSPRLPLYGDPPPRYNPRSQSPDSAPFQNYIWTCISLYKIHRPRTWLSCFRWTLLVLLILGLIIDLPCKLHVELMVQPFARCFEQSRLSRLYNMTTAVSSPKFRNHSGLLHESGILAHDRDPTGNYSTLAISREPCVLRTNAEFPRQRAYLALPWAFPDNFEVRVINWNALAQGTALEGSHLLNKSDDRAWVDGDLLRLLVTWAHGGVWVDTDSLLIRDMSPLLEHELVTQWDCYAFQRRGDALLQALAVPLRGVPHHGARPAPRSGTTDWGSLLYHKLFRRLMAAGIQPFKVLPFCLTDARSCRLDNRLPDPFKPDPVSWGGSGSSGVLEGGRLDDTLHKIFSVHLHNQWDKKFPKGGWVERLLLRRYDLHLPEPTP
ncbi:hypothetical protein EXIGLDRAFT_845897 [Exidia glandulosa HHB12029]|uniref:Glycosyltransferase family 32 protein n=1 Tax=Exidia glandulosa HHB12029 TaxID=1314781 RepID=A0A165B8I8_EXIGL|nr:hypothetical protein EXIGLDRAFT_845897 [Exidia glandulosa HHB12029]